MSLLTKKEQQIRSSIRKDEIKERKSKMREKVVNYSILQHIEDCVYQEMNPGYFIGQMIDLIYLSDNTDQYKQKICSRGIVLPYLKKFLEESWINLDFEEEYCSLLQITRELVAYSSQNYNTLTLGQFSQLLTNRPQNIKVETLELFIKVFMLFTNFDKEKKTDRARFKEIIDNLNKQLNNQEQSLSKEVLGEIDALTYSFEEKRKNFLSKIGIQLFQEMKKYIFQNLQLLEQSINQKSEKRYLLQDLMIICSFKEQERILLQSGRSQMSIASYLYTKLENLLDKKRQQIRRRMTKLIQLYPNQITDHIRNSKKITFNKDCYQEQFEKWELFDYSLLMDIPNQGEDILSCIQNKLKKGGTMPIQNTVHEETQIQRVIKNILTPEINKIGSEVIDQVKNYQVFDLEKEFIMIQWKQLSQEQIIKINQKKRNVFFKSVLSLVEDEQ